MKTKKILLFIPSLFLIIGMIACKKEKNNLDVLENTAIITYSDPATDGCGWKININEKEYHPINLNEKYKINGLKVDLKYNLLSSIWECSQWTAKKYQEIEIVNIVNTMSTFKCSCEKNVEVELNNLLGEWKLEKVRTVFKELQTYDYSSFDIKYIFKENGILVISSDIKFVGGDSGEFTYRLLENGSILEIDKSEVNCCLSDTKLQLDYSILDGPILCLTKIL